MSKNLIALKDNQCGGWVVAAGDDACCTTSIAHFYGEDAERNAKLFIDALNAGEN